MQVGIWCTIVQGCLRNSEDFYIDKNKSFFTKVRWRPIATTNMCPSEKAGHPRIKLFMSPN